MISSKGEKGESVLGPSGECNHNSVIRSQRCPGWGVGKRKAFDKRMEDVNDLTTAERRLVNEWQAPASSRDSQAAYGPVPELITRSSIRSPRETPDEGERSRKKESGDGHVVRGLLARI